MEREAVSATLARNLAENELKSPQAALQAKEREVLELQQSRSKLMAGLNTLLQNFKAREAALIVAKGRIQALGERLAAAEADLAERQLKIEQSGILPESDFTSRVLSGVDACGKAQAIGPAPKALFADRDGSHEPSRQPAVVRTAATLLAETVTF